MAALFETFDASTVEPRGDFEILPAGDYVMQIIDSEKKPTKSGNGHYWKLDFVIIDGKLEGRKYWERLNLDNPNPTAVKIARQALAEMCTAVGRASVEDTSELHFQPMLVKIAAKARKDGGGLENTARFAPLNGAAPLVSSAAKMTPAAASAVAAGDPATGAKKKPWEKAK